MKKLTILLFFTVFVVLHPAQATTQTFYITGPGLETYSLQFDYLATIETSSNVVGFDINATLFFDQFSTKILSDLRLIVYVESLGKVVTSSSMTEEKINASDGKWEDTVRFTFPYEGGQLNLKYNLTFLESSDNGNTFAQAQFLDLTVDSFEFTLTTPLPSAQTPTDTQTVSTVISDPKLNIPIESILTTIFIFLFIFGMTRSSSRRRKKRKERMSRTWMQPAKPLIVEPQKMTVPITCVSCGAKITPGDSFCYSCGVKIGE